MKTFIAASMFLGLAVGCVSIPPGASTDRNLGWQTPLGNGTATTYAEFDGQGVPRTIGVVWSSGALDGLPAGSDEHRCHARTKEGLMDSMTRCQHTVEHAMPLPD